jgi:transcriptional regulator with XRE-family HTH domain
MLGDLIRRRRLELELTQVQLEDRTGIPQTYISQIERGTVAAPGRDKLEPIAIALGLPLWRLAAAAIEAPIRGVEVDATRAVPVYGYIPADSVRFTGPLDDMPAIHVVAEMIAGARDPYALLVTGDCLAAIGILHGDAVILDHPSGHRPRPGQVVAVRMGAEVTLKRWMPRADGTIELRDGDGRLVATLDGSVSVEVIGLYVYHLPDAKRGATPACGECITGGQRVLRLPTQTP